MFDARERVLRRDGQPVQLTPKAFDLLAAFVAQPGRLLSKDELLKRVWPDTFVEESNLAYHVFALRKALGDTTRNGAHIETVPKRGYRFTAIVNTVGQAPGEHGPSGVSAGTDSPPPGIDTLATDVDAGVSGSPQPGSGRLVLRTGTNAPATPLPHAPALHPGGTEQNSRRAPRFSSSQRLGIASLLLLLLMAPALFFAVRTWRTMGTPNEPPRALPLMSVAGAVRAPSLSPDGAYVVFTWTGEKQENPDLYVQQIGAGVPLRVTTHPDNDFSPAWSPDGRTIAFLRRTPTGDHSEVLLIAPLGGPERKIADVSPRLPSYKPLSIGWCPDSRCVIVTDSRAVGEPDALFVIALDTGEKRRLTDPKGLVGDGDPAASPDGRWLVFRRDSTPFSGQFYRLALTDGMRPEGAPVRLTSTVSAGKPSWMPDSRTILFAARGALWRLDALRGGTPARLPFVGQDGQSPVVSRDADGQQRLVYVRSFADGNVWRVNTAMRGAAAEAVPVPAVASTRTDAIPNVSPDGRRIAFLSDRLGEPQIWVADTEGSNAAQLTSLTFASSPGFPRWSPDGKTIAFHGDPAGRPDVIVVPASGGRPRNLTAEGPNAGFPSFSRDGRWIYFCSIQNGQARVWKIPASGGAAVRVTTDEGRLGIESPDGRDLYYVTAIERPSALWRVPVAGGTPVKILDGVLFGSFDVIERGIYYIDRVSGGAAGFFTDRTGGDTRLQFFDFATRLTSTVSRNLGSVVGLSALRDGSTVFFSRTDSSVDELMVVNDFQ